MNKDLGKIVYCDENVLSGTPCFIGTRVPISIIMEYVSLGWSIGDLKEAYPNVKSEYISKLIKALSEDLAAHVKTV